MRAGLPTTSTRGGTFLTTTAPAPTNASSPISTAGQRTAPAPTRAPRRIVGPFRRACRFAVRPMKLSFVVITRGAMNTLSSSVEYAVTYASAWIFVSSPIVVSFSTSAPRPMTTLSPTSQRSRTHAWSPTITRAPTRVPAKTIAPVETIVPGPSSSGGRSSCFVVERGPGDLGLHSGRDCFERGLQLIEHADDRNRVTRDLVRLALARDQPQEVLALTPQRLCRVDRRTVDVARAGSPVVVDRDLPVPLHVVEHRHPLVADDGDSPDLVWIQPGQMHVRHLPGWKAEIAEDHILDPAAQECIAVRAHLARLFFD